MPPVVPPIFVGVSAESNVSNLTDYVMNLPNRRHVNSDNTLHNEMELCDTPVTKEKFTCAIDDNSVEMWSGEHINTSTVQKNTETCESMLSEHVFHDASNGLWESKSFENNYHNLNNIMNEDVGENVDEDGSVKDQDVLNVDFSGSWEDTEHMNDPMNIMEPTCITNSVVTQVILESCSGEGRSSTINMVPEKCENTATKKFQYSGTPVGVMGISKVHICVGMCSQTS